MNRSLYVAVDESGREADDDVFTTASCWYVSTDPPESALNPVREAVQGLLTDLGYPADNDELKGKDMIGEPREQFFRCLTSCFDKYGTVEDEFLPWDGYEVQFRYGTLPARQARAVASHPSDTLSAEEAMRRLMLLEQLTPLFSDRLDYEYVDDVVVLLDGESWENPRRSIRRNLQFRRDPSFEFRSGDSKKYKGIQFADVVANTLYRRLNGTDHDTELSSIREMLWR